ncbi:TIGR02453 family protein [Roseisalinus antarcticus]|uniref:TIGR02453 family protein n=1 Tax=Roseisalinus antarcticus TaxID=254357 RepID=A0A1Y5STA2_9RHOB|nr:TIGR02453 family protein [Roseisalinus antarcticus]SLN47598.1 hypothetical protein ROA7023_02013 [Roseisalinus antarcticus]
MADQLVTDARRFLSELADNNSRAWFLEHKATFEDKLKAPALGLLERLSAPLGKFMGAPVSTKLFRPNRDVRFSKDKTPYTLHLHMMWSVRAAAGGPGPAFFLGIGLEYLTAGGGIMAFDGQTLPLYRAAVDDAPGEWLDLVAAAQRSGFSLREPELKRVPAPYDRDHPAADLLRQKGFAVWRELAGASLQAEAVAAFTGLLPLQRRLIALH